MLNASNVLPCILLSVIFANVTSLLPLEQLRLQSPVVGVASQLSRWRQLTLQEVQGFQQQFGKALGLFNLQERTSRFFLATFQREKGKGKACMYVCVYACVCVWHLVLVPTSI